MYTKEKRRERYKKMLDYIGGAIKPDGVYNAGLCFTLYKIGMRKCLLERFPEIMKHEPKRPHQAFWFPINKAGTDRRIRILLEAVMDTYES